MTVIVYRSETAFSLEKACSYCLGDRRNVVVVLADFQNMSIVGKLRRQVMIIVEHIHVTGFQWWHGIIESVCNRTARVSFITNRKCLNLRGSCFTVVLNIVMYFEWVTTEDLVDCWVTVDTVLESNWPDFTLIALFCWFQGALGKGSREPARVVRCQ